ncbi:hypothetical protein [Neobacillus soli]|nr:hypothetical protein [Neobacillus soli]
MMKRLVLGLEFQSLGALRTKEKIMLFLRSGHGFNFEVGHRS